MLTPLERPSLTLAALASSLFFASASRADPSRLAYADPPYPAPRPQPVYVADEREPAPPEPYLPPSSSWFRLSVGTAGRTSLDTLRAGLFAAADLGRGPAGFRLSGAWVRVGYDDPLAQYSGELTLSPAWNSRLSPSFGAGGGLARTYRVDAAGAKIGGGSSVGVGVLRAGLDYRLPLGDTDARAGAGAMLSVPAIRGEGAPDLAPWLLLTATVGIGF